MPADATLKNSEIKYAKTTYFMGGFIFLDKIV